MKEKEKGKFNPFVGILHPDEEILWFYKPPILSLGLHLRGCIWVYVMFFIFMIAAFVLQLVFMDAAATVSRLNPLRESWLKVWLDLVLKNLTWFSLPALLGFAISYPLAWIEYRRWNVSYALTSERLLHNKMGVNTLPLENLQAFKLSSPNRLDFTGLPAWEDIEGAEEVLKLIEKARENRLNRLSQVQAEHGEERIVLENEALSKRGRA